MNGIYFFIASLGMLFFSKIGTIVYQMYGVNYPFALLGLFDLMFILFLGVSYITGIFRQ